MAETFLTPVIEGLVKLLTDEVKSLKGVHKEVENLISELKIIQFLLKDADAKSERGELGEAVVAWVQSLMKEADHIEDVIDEYRYHVVESTTDKPGFTGFLCKTGRRIKALKSSYLIASKIRKINESLHNLKDMGRAYGLSQLLAVKESSSKAAYIEEAHDPRLGSYFIEEDEYVDVPFVQEELTRSLIERDLTHKVISLVGQGGIGKTTLVKKVYEEVKHNFDHHVWITVSQSYDVNQLLKNMMQQIHVAAESTTDIIQGLITPIRRCLQTKRYVVVFDDVWDTMFWEAIKHALPKNNKGSRIIITTRHTTVVDCQEFQSDIIQNLENWSSHMAWELFCKKAFRNESQSCCSEDLKELSYQIVSKCQGLPLTIGVIAGILSRKRKVKFEWQNVLNNLNSEFKTNSQLTKILSLSFHDLPNHLKPCLLYFGIFPEDYRISGKRLCALWIAESFVKAGRDRTLMEQANDYLNELVKRNLVSIEVDVGVHIYCKIHDLMHEFIVSKANDSLLWAKSRRISIHGDMTNLSEMKDNSSSIRSIFPFNFNDELIGMSYLVTLFQTFKHLKVLDFEGAPLDSLPKEIGNLFHLRYLGMRFTKIKVLPKSIGKLHNLQTLDLAFTQLQMLPTSIGELHNLQALYVDFTLIQELPVEIYKLLNLQCLFAIYQDTTKDGQLLGVKIQKGFGFLKKLEELEDVEVPAVGGVDFVKELESLTKLKRLCVSNLTTETARALCVCTEELKRLEHLRLQAANYGDEILDVEAISSSPPPLLHILDLDGRLQKFPHWISELWHLQTLFLLYSKLTDDPLKYLKDLPNLMTLRLIDSYEGEQLHFEEGGFLKLKELKLSCFTGLKLVEIDRGTMPLLKTLIIAYCPLMEEVPSGVQHLRNLKQLKIKRMPSEFVARLQPNGGQDYPKIQHVPKVRILKTR